MRFNSFYNQESMCSSLAETVVRRLKSALQQHNQASLIVSGGSTPKLLFTKLSQTPFEWDKVTITLADERWTDPATPYSNEYLVRSSLLVNHAARAKFIGLKNAHDTARNGEAACRKELQKIKAPFDIVLLGMGDDGHTASLFPGAKELPDALEPRNGKAAVAITPEPMPENAAFERITMTLPGLLDSCWIVLLIAGQQKLSVYNEALAGDNVSKMPVRGILKQTGTPVSCYWAP